MKFGIVLYNIEMNGNLNGVYTNNVHGGTIYTETARLISKAGGIETYEVFYFDSGGSSHQGILTIHNKSGILDCVWTINGKNWFKGQGFKMNERQIAIHYTKY